MRSFSSRIAKGRITVCNNAIQLSRVSQCNMQSQSANIADTIEGTWEHAVDLKSIVELVEAVVGVQVVVG